MSDSVFVFGSNLKGVHGAGAAKFAVQRHGAVMGEGIGHFGNSYALPTKDRNIITLSKTAIRIFVGDFLKYATAHPELTFQVTRIGCGLAGYQHRDIAPMFVGAPKNCQFDDAWRPYLESKESCSRNDGIFDYVYWGHVE